MNTFFVFFCNFFKKTYTKRENLIFQNLFEFIIFQTLLKILFVSF